MAEGSQTFEQDLAPHDHRGHVITRDEGLAYADSPTNLMWRLQNDMSPVVAEPSRRRKRPTTSRRFTEITLDVRRKKSHAVAEPAAFLIEPVSRPCTSPNS